MIEHYSLCIQLCKSKLITFNYGFLTVLLSLLVLSVSPVLGQYEYSDAYTVDSSDNAYDAENDAFIMGENVPPLDLVGVGVSESGYDNNTYSTSTTTTVTTPSGANAVTNFSSGYSYARAEAFSLQLDPDTAEEGDYTVTSEHTYYQDSCYTPRDQPAMPCGPVSKLSTKASQTPFLNVSNKMSPVFSPTLYPYYTSYTSYSSFPISVRTYFNGYQYVGPGYAGCGTGIHPPFGYRAYCDIRTPCQKAALCAAGVSAGIQVVALKIRYFLVSVCYSRGVYVPTRPRCSPPAY